MLVDTEDVQVPYRERRLKRWVRRHFASKESRTGVSKSESRRERLIMHIYCVTAVACFLLAMLFPFPRVSLLWAQAVCMAVCAFWCALAGLYESASDWQRAAWLTAQSRSAKAAQLFERMGSEDAAEELGDI